ncbi:23449_t:CDS:2, partial [Dentiscutata erythropus]
SSPLQLPETIRVDPVFHVSLLNLYHSNEFENRNITPPPPILIGVRLLVDEFEKGMGLSLSGGECKEIDYLFKDLKAKP